MKIDGFVDIDNEIALEKGVRFEYTLDFGKVWFQALIAGDDNPAFQTAMLQHSKDAALRERLAGATASVDDNFKGLLGVYHDTVVKAWGTDIKSEGKAIQTTRANFIDLFSSRACRRAFFAFQAQVSDMAHFRREIEAETEKN